MLEFDAVSFSHASFLLEFHDFYFLLYVSVPMNFPRDRPVFVFQSVYHSSYGKTFKIRCEEYPYSPRWDQSEMVDRACMRVFRLLHRSVSEDFSSELSYLW